MPINPFCVRLNAMTDDLDQIDLYNFLADMLNAGTLTFRDLEQWRKKNDMPVDNTD